MNILLIGGGGREHALAWKIAQSPLLSTLFIAPGNPGMAGLGTLVSLSPSNASQVVDFCKAQNIGLVVVGPEQPLVDGLADVLTGHGINVFGPRKLAAMLEGSKAFAKSVMQAQNVPTASFKSFTAGEFENAVDYCRTEATLPIVLKLDGLAAGKGVFICETREEAFGHLHSVSKDSSLASAAATLVIESFMEGEEVSVFALCDGRNFVLLSPAQDHKRIGDGDTGPNTGGMGAYAPARLLSAEQEQFVADTIIRPVLREMELRGCPYVGVLYCGLMLTPTGPKVVEFNCRFGDPECEVLMPLLESDLVELMMHAVNGTIGQTSVILKNGFACTVVAAAEGYPQAPRRGDIIEIETLPSELTLLFHAGTALKEGKLVTSGGRVMNCLGLGDTLQESIDNAYRASASVRFHGKYQRSDIGKKGLHREAGRR